MHTNGTAQAQIENKRYISVRLWHSDGTQIQIIIHIPSLEKYRYVSGYGYYCRLDIIFFKKRVKISRPCGELEYKDNNLWTMKWWLYT